MAQFGDLCLEQMRQGFCFDHGNEHSGLAVFKDPALPGKVVRQLMTANRWIDWYRYRTGENDPEKSIKVRFPRRQHDRYAITCLDSTHLQAAGSSNGIVVKIPVSNYLVGLSALQKADMRTICMS